MCEVDVNVDEEILERAEKEVNGDIAEIEEGEVIVEKRSQSHEEEEEEEKEEGKERF